MLMELLENTSANKKSTPAMPGSDLVPGEHQFEGGIAHWVQPRTPHGNIVATLWANVAKTPSIELSLGEKQEGEILEAVRITLETKEFRTPPPNFNAFWIREYLLPNLCELLDRRKSRGTPRQGTPY